MRGSEATEAIYKYDYLGRRIKTNNNGAITCYVYDGNRIIAEYDSTGLICEYVYGNNIDEILYMIKDADVYYYHYDGLGSVRAITDESEAVIETYTYDVYGKPAIYDASGTKITESQPGNRFYFTGREFDKESGLYYYRARYYDPTLGRFMSPDPLGPVDGPNLYTYVKNNPVNWIDSLGLCSSAKERITQTANDYYDGLWGPLGDMKRAITAGLKASLGMLSETLKAAATLYDAVDAESRCDTGKSLVGVTQSE